MPKPASLLENNKHQLSWGFDIQSNHLISTRKSDLIIINKKKKKKREITFIIVDFVALANQRMKLKECEKKEKYPDLARE